VRTPNLCNGFQLSKSNLQELYTMTTRKLMSAAFALMLLAGTPVLAMAEEAAPAVEATTEATTEAPADDAAPANDAAPADEEAAADAEAPAAE
jgi:hypothetical protein